VSDLDRNVSRRDEPRRDEPRRDEPSRDDARSTPDADAASFDGGSFDGGSFDGASFDGASFDPDALDPELAALPAPPRGRRVLVLALMALVMFAASALAFSLRHDVAYFFSRPSTIDLGDVRSVDPARLEPNSQVRVLGTPMVSKTVRFQRVLTRGRYVVFPLAGQRTVYVQVPDDEAAIGRNEFSGRLVTFGQLGGRIATVRGYLKDEMRLPVSSESFLILADESPASYAWALVLFGLCLLFVALDVFLLLRWFRPLPRLHPAVQPAPLAR
jgi:hypothetical protein